jgi:histidyl-tRNA synthetase
MLLAEAYPPCEHHYRIMCSLHIGILSQEKIEDEAQNGIMQSMDKKECDEAIVPVEEADASEKCLETLRNLAKREQKTVKIEKMVEKIRG